MSKLIAQNLAFMKTIVYCLLILCCWSCASTKTASTTEDEDKTFESISNNEPFEIESNWAQPQVTTAYAQLGGLLPAGSTPGNISLIGNTNYFQIKDSIVRAFLPFYGERRQSGPYMSGKTGIEFESAPQDFKANIGKKNSYEIRFNINDKNYTSESYMVYVQVFPNLSSSIMVSSSHRSSMTYRGKANIIENDEK